NLPACPAAGQKFATLLVKYNDLGVSQRSALLTVNFNGIARFDVSTAGGFPSPSIAQVFSSAGTVPLNTWTYMAGAFDSATRTLSLYVNGVLVGTTVAPFSTVYDSNEPLLIGAADAGALPTGRE